MAKEENNNSKPMGFWSAASIGVGAMIGAGIFALVGVAADIAGQMAYLAFIIAGIVALLTTYSVSRLAVTFPSKGGRVEFLNKGFGRGIFSGTLNIVMWMGYIIVTSLYARTFAEYGVALLGVGEESVWLYILSSSIVLLFVLINFVGASLVGQSELFVVAVKVVILLFFGLLGLSTVSATEFIVAEEFHFSDVILASGVIFMSYEGFGLVANTAEDIENPQKNLPRALFVSVIMVMFIYVLVSVAVIGNLSISTILEAKEYALAEAAKPLLGTVGFQVMGIAALFSTASAINATIYGPVHMVQETAKAGQLPSILVKKLFGHESGYALLLTGLLILIISNLLNLEAIAETGSLIFLIIYTAVNVANLRLRHQTNSRQVPTWLAILGTTFSFCALFYFQLQEASISISVLAAILVGATIYEWLYQK